MAEPKIIQRAPVIVGFKIIDYLNETEALTKYTTASSDVQSLSMRELVNMADEETRALWEDLSLGYRDSYGYPALRREIAEFHGMDKDDVMVVTGQEAIYIAMNSMVCHLTKKHNLNRVHALAISPAFQSMHEDLKQIGCDLEEWKAKLDGGRWCFSVTDLRAQIKANTRIVVVNFPHNPTGFVPDDKDWRELIDLCKSRELYLFSDEIYRGSNNDDATPLPSACALYDNAISMASTSKVLACPGLRIGWLCTKNREVQKVMYQFRSFISVCSPGPSEILALIALKNREKIIKRTVNLLRANLQVLNDFMKKNDDVFDWFPPKASTFGCARMKGWLLELGQGKGTKTCDVILRETGVLLLPTSVFDYPEEFIRIGFCRENLPEALRILDSFLQNNRLPLLAN